MLFDLGQAAENMMLVAWELGIGSVPATVYDHDLARRFLGYPADRHCEYLLSFGYPADPTTSSGRSVPADGARSARWSTTRAGEPSLPLEAAGGEPEADDRPADEDRDADRQRRDRPPRRP